MNKISDILNEQVFDKSGYSASIKKAVAFGFWKDITGAKFANLSKPYDIKGKTLYVSVKTPSVMQELIFYKTDLLRKIKNYFLPVGIVIEDIKYDYKSWNKISSGENYMTGDESLEYYTEDEIQETELSLFEEGEIEKATNTISNLVFLDEKLKNLMKKNMINSIKAKKIRQ